MTATEETAVATIDQVTILTPEIYNKDGGIAKICAMIELEVAGFEPDLSTDTGRKEIASMAYKVAQSKTHLVKLGKELTKGWRESTKAVNAQIKETEDRLNIVRDDIRKPLTDWEQAEEKRIERVSIQLATIHAIGVIDFDSTFEDMEKLLENANSIVIDSEVMKHQTSEAEDMLSEAKSRIQVAMIKKKQEIAQQEELEQLRADKAESERKLKEIEDAEAKRLQDEADKIEADKQAEIDKIKAEHDKKESDRLAEEKAERIKEENERLASERREENELNRQRITTEIAFCFENVGLDATSAKLAAEGVMDGKIRNVSVTF